MLARPISTVCIALVALLAPGAANADPPKASINVTTNNGTAINVSADRSGNKTTAISWPNGQRLVSQSSQNGATRTVSNTMYQSNGAVQSTWGHTTTRQVNIQNSGITATKTTVGRDAMGRNINSVVTVVTRPTPAPQSAPRAAVAATGTSVQRTPFVIRAKAK